MPARHKGAISFGLVHIPIQLYKTTHDNDISFNQLCKETKERIKYKKFCPHCNKEVKTSDIVKGYQYEKDKYIIMSDEELEQLKSETDRTIHILQFTKLDEIDDIYYEKNFYAIPEKGGEKAFELLHQAMLEEKSVAIAKTVMGTKESLLALCPTKEGILVKTLFYEDEIESIPKEIPAQKIAKNELTMAKTLIKSMAQPFDPSQYEDEYQKRLKAAIEAKIDGKEISEAKHEDSTNIMDLMDALKQSVAMSKKAAPKRTRHQA